MTLKKNSFIAQTTIDYDLAYIKKLLKNYNSVKYEWKK